MNIPELYVAYNPVQTFAFLRTGIYGWLLKEMQKMYTNTIKYYANFMQYQCHERLLTL